jgi:peptide/nickel transport system permease protein
VKRRVAAASRTGLRGLISLVITMVIASVALFVLMRVIPGDPASVLAGDANATQQSIAQVRHSLGLDQSIYAQYLSWLGNALHGNLGASYFSRDSVTSVIATTLPDTLWIVFGGLLLAGAIGIPAGILAALQVHRPADSAIRQVATVASAIPAFWLGGLLAGLLAIKFRLFPATGFVSPTADPAGFISHLVLPCVAVALSIAASVTRQTRSAMLEALSAESIRTLRAMGIPEWKIVWQHALKNASVPVVTVLGLDMNRAISGVVVVESVFGIPGIGSQLVSSVLQRDFPVVQGGILTLILLVMVLNLLLDVVCSVLDPRTANAGLRSRARRPRRRLAPAAPEATVAALQASTGGEA